jgi:hypothetical protein
MMSPFMEEKLILEDENISDEEKEQRINRVWLMHEELSRILEGRYAPGYGQCGNAAEKLKD